jgi:hypothetical protein
VPLLYLVPRVLNYNYDYVHYNYDYVQYDIQGELVRFERRPFAGNLVMSVSGTTDLQDVILQLPNNHLPWKHVRGNKKIALPYVLHYNVFRFMPAIMV